VQVLIFHGYLLRGTGSNVYNADLAAALVELGHEVHLVCQDRRASEFEFVGQVGDWDEGELRLARIRDAACTVYRPDIGGLLPVYVEDRYEGLEARPFQELTDAELDTYLLANERAVSEVVARADIDVALANHLVMGPAILARALAGTDIPYAVKIHGSALEYTVKPYPRFLPYALEGIAPAKAVLVGSHRDGDNLWAALGDPSVPSRTRLGTPGVDVAAFRPRPRHEALARLRALADDMAEQARLEAERPRSGSSADAGSSSFSHDHAAAASALSALVPASQSGPLIGFVGKLIVSKGIDLLLAAWPLVLDAVPSASLMVVGFGAYHDAVERWIDALSSGDMPAVQELVDIGRAAEGGEGPSLTLETSFFAELERSGELQRYLTAAAQMRDSVILTGLLEHAELAVVLPLCEALVVPSTFPESFGMVVVEAAACGALPISAAHSGLAEVSRTLTGALPEPVRELVTFPLGSDVVRSIAARVIEWLQAPTELREAAKAALPQAVATRYSWTSIARDVIAAARGELEGLEPVA
jgi:glycosyltransferase involved in cell wall biosynthesis